MSSGQTDSYADELENRRKLEEWKEHKKREAEAEARRQKQSALEAHLAERARLYFDHTGTTPSTSLLEDWQRQYVDAQAQQRETERGARLQAAIDEHYPY